MKKIYVVGDAYHYAKFINDYKLVKNINDADIVLFTGGEDVDPSLYGEEAIPGTYFNSTRDAYEVEMFNQISPKQLAIGICRGSQFLCVMNGGKLVQNLNNHALFTTHSIVEKKTGVDYDITSTHHQLQYPYNLSNKDYEVLFFTRRSYYYEGGGISYALLDSYGEPEVVVYKKQDKPVCLAIQGHPEYMKTESPIIGKLNSIIDSLLNK